MPLLSKVMAFFYSIRSPSSISLFICNLDLNDSIPFMKKEKVVSFYDDFVSNQRNVSINERIYSLYQRMLQYGLHENSNVVELGCGIGTVSYLISKTVTKGKIESVDISPESVKFAESKLKHPNRTFKAADVVKYTPDTKNIDFITLFDVIEHIPMEHHPELFHNISTYMNEQSMLLINIPSPGSIKYDEKHQPELLQVIDQAIPFDFLVKNILDNGLELVFFETYSIWIKDDYQFFAIRKKQDFQNSRLADQRSFSEKVKKKLQNWWVKLNYSYK